MTIPCNSSGEIQKSLLIHVHPGVCRTVPSMAPSACIPCHRARHRATRKQRMEREAIAEPWDVETPLSSGPSPQNAEVGGVWEDAEWTTTRVDANDHIADSVNSPNPASQVKLLQAIRCRAQETIVVGSAYHAHRPHQLRHIAAAPPGIRRNMHLRGSRVRFPYGRRPCWSWCSAITVPLTEPADAED